MLLKNSTFSRKMTLPTFTAANFHNSGSINFFSVQSNMIPFSSKLLLHKAVAAGNHHFLTANSEKIERRNSKM